MRFSEHFRVSRRAADDWFDPLLEVDTRLFVDPFRIFADSRARWTGAHGRLVDFFNLVLELVARSEFRRNSAHWRAAERLLIFPEPLEFCLGYAERSTRGAGSGRGLQTGMLEGARTAIQAGIQAVSHFEELTLFREGIGADRISDIVGNVLKREFISYTQTIGRRHGLSTQSIRSRHIDWSRQHVRWEDGEVSLPLNPFSERPVLLVPRRFLRELPTVDPADFWDWSWTNENEKLRGEFNYEIGRNVDAATIAALARRHPDLVQAYTAALEQHPKDAYDIDEDPAGEVHWWEYGALFARRAPRPSLPRRREDVCSLVSQVIDVFRHNVEDQDGWQLLWHKDTARSERIVQALFRSTVQHYCQAYDVDLSGESNAGRGPVDFKFSKGWRARSLVEVKLANNAKFWHGLTEQTPTYMRAEGIECAYFLVVCFRDSDYEPERQNDVLRAAAAYRKREKLIITPVYVDARRKRSASRT